MNYRDRKLLDLAHRVQECQSCGRWCEEGCEPAHENGLAAGKGQGIKSGDHYHAACCHACHSWYDSGTGMSPCGQHLGDRIGKRTMFERAYRKTVTLYWTSGWIGVMP